MHHADVRCGEGQLFAIQAIEPEIFPLRRRHHPVHALQLQAQHHHHVAAGNTLAHVVEHLDVPALGGDGDQGRRADQPYVRAQHLQHGNVRPRHTAVQHVATDCDLEARDMAKGPAHRQRVEQGLRGVLMLPVTGVDHRTAHLLRQQAGGAGRGVPHH